MRWAVWKLLEQPGAPGQGILAFVTNHGFVWNRVHCGIRKALLDAFDEIWVFNLHGNRRLASREVLDENVFVPVKQGIALSVFVRRPGPHLGPARVHYREMRGRRAEKYAAPQETRLAGPGWTDVTPEAPYWSFAPSGPDDRYGSWPSIREVFPVSNSGVQTQRDDLVSDTDRGALLARMRQLTDRSLAATELRQQLSIPENTQWRLDRQRSAFAPFEEARALPWLYRLFDRRLVYWDPEMMGRARESLMRHLLPEAFGFGGQRRRALVVQRGRPITTIATMTRGIATSDVTGYWCHVYPLHLATGFVEGLLLPQEETWTENLEPDLAARLLDRYGLAVGVEQVADYVFGVLSAPAYRRRFAADLAIDHPHVPFPADAGVFERMQSLGAELAAAHLLEAPVSTDIRFEGEGTNAVERPRHDESTATVWINRNQRFTGVPAEAWAWGGAFRPLEHYLEDRRGRTLDLDQIEAYQRAIHAVREAIRLEPLLDEQLARILAAPLDFRSAA